MRSSGQPPFWLGAFAVCLVIAGIQYPAVRFGFIGTDHAEIEMGALVPENGEQLWRTLVHRKGEAIPSPRAQYQKPTAPREQREKGLGYYRPVKALSYALDHALGRGQAWMFHLTNLLLHAGVCLSGLWLLRSWLGVRWPWLAEAVALFHAASPLHTEVAVWISARSDSLMTLFCLLALSFLVRSRRALRPWLWRWGSAVALSLAIGSKESGLMVLPMLAVFSLGMPDPRQPIAWRRLLAECGPAAVLAVFIIAFRLLVVSDVALGAVSGLPALNAWTILDVFGRNLWMSLIPHGMSVADTVAVVDGPSALGVSGALAYLTWLLLGVRLWRTQPAILLGAVMWLLCLLPVSQLVPLLHPRADRYLYGPAWFAELSLIGGLVALAQLGKFSKPLSIALLAAGLLAFVSLGLSTRVTARMWTSEETLYQWAIGQQPACVECWNHLAFYYARSGSLQGAIDCCCEALRVDRRRMRGAQDGFSLRWILAQASLLLGKPHDAIAYLEEIVVKAGATPANLGMLARAYSQAGRHAHAMSAYSRAADLSGLEGRRFEELANQEARAERLAGFPLLFEFPEGCLSESR